MFIVIEKYDGWENAAIIISPTGKNMVFDDINDAADEADLCQDGIVIGDEIIEAEDTHAWKMEELTDMGNKLLEIQEVLTAKPTAKKVVEAAAMVNKMSKQLEELKSKILWK
jgi:hypothetical protein